jgi:hypothetical protein
MKKTINESLLDHRLQIDAAERFQALAAATDHSMVALCSVSACNFL